MRAASVYEALAAYFRCVCPGTSLGVCKLLCPSANLALRKGVCAFLRHNISRM